MSKHPRGSLVTSTQVLKHPYCVSGSLTKRARIYTTETTLLSENLVINEHKRVGTSSLFADIITDKNYDEWPSNLKNGVDLLNLSYSFDNKEICYNRNVSSLSLLPDNQLASLYHIDNARSSLIGHNGISSSNCRHHDILNYLEHLMKFINTTPLPEVLFL